jgi:hypothetical protein
VVDLSPLFSGDGLAVRGMHLFKRVGHRDPLINKYGTIEVSKILREPLREALFANDIISEIFPMIAISGA